MSPALDNLLQKYQNLFDNHIGTLKGFHAQLTVNHAAQPLFLKPQLLPYLLKEKVEKE